MAKNNNLTDFLTDTANAIRGRTGGTGTINPQDFATQITNIPDSKHAIMIVKNFTASNSGTKTLSFTCDFKPKTIRAFYTFGGSGIYLTGSNDPSITVTTSTKSTYGGEYVTSMTAVLSGTSYIAYGNGYEIYLRRSSTSLSGTMSSSIESVKYTTTLSVSGNTYTFTANYPLACPNASSTGYGSWIIVATDF